jgi:hypothetical protein
MWSLGCALEGDFEISVSCSLCFWLPWSEQLPHYMLPPDIYPHHMPESNEPNWLWTETSKTMSQNKHFALLSWFISGIYHSKGKLINTLIYNNMWHTIDASQILDERCIRMHMIHTQILYTYMYCIQFVLIHTAVSSKFLPIFFHSQFSAG